MPKLNVQLDFVPNYINLDTIYDHSQKYPKHYHFEVGEDINVIVSVDGQKSQIQVPKSFKTDLASVPKIPVLYTKMKLADIMAPVVHDYLYSTKMFDRYTCDLIFKKLMKYNGVPSRIAETMYLGVHWFGGSHY